MLSVGHHEAFAEEGLCGYCGTMVGGGAIMQEAVLGYNFLLSSAQWPKHSFTTDKHSHWPN